MSATHNHAKSNFLSAILLLHSLVQDDIQEDIITAQNTNNLAAAVELDKQALIEVLNTDGRDVSMRTERCEEEVIIWKCDKEYRELRCWIRVSSIPSLVLAEREP